MGDAISVMWKQIELALQNHVPALYEALAPPQKQQR